MKLQKKIEKLEAKYGITATKYGFKDELISTIKQELLKEIEKVEPIKRGKWILHYDWISRDEIIKILNKVL